MYGGNGLNVGHQKNMEGLRVLSFFYVKHWGVFFWPFIPFISIFFSSSTYPFLANSFHFLVGLKVLCLFFCLYQVALHVMLLKDKKIFEI
jgi:hypothetical protein